MLPPKDGAETRSKCPVIGCKSYLQVAYKDIGPYAIKCILQCPNCGHEDKSSDEGLKLPLISKSYGKCYLRAAADIMILCDEHFCKICGDITVTFVFPENMIEHEAVKKYPCCGTFSCYLKLVTEIESGNI